MNVYVICRLSFTVSLTLLGTAGTSVTSGTLYKKRDDCRVAESNEIPLCDLGVCRYGGRKSCVLACHAHAQCASVNFRPSDSQCLGTMSTAYGFSSSIAPDSSGWENYSPDSNDVRDGDWVLVFRARYDSFHEQSVGETYDAWINDSLRSDDHLDSLPRDCFDNVASDGCSGQLYRSHWLTDWPSSEIAQVRLSLFTGGEEKVRLVFNGQGSTRDDWFSGSRLVSSPWTDLTPGDPANLLSLPGVLVNKRIFVATSTPDGNDCNQLGWLLVMNKPDNGCRFEFDTTVVNDTVPSVPQFLYAPGSTKVNFATSGAYATAEVMAIFIKLS